MAMDETIGKFAQQFSWEPLVVNHEKLQPHSTFVVCGMGGSQLGPMLIQSQKPAGTMILHRDYGLPELSSHLEKNSLVILSSYSGTTEETLDSAKAAIDKGLPVAVVSTNGGLLEIARQLALPYVQIPETGLQPRLAIGFSMIAIARLMGDINLLAHIRDAAKNLILTARKEEGLELAKKLEGKLPVIYTSRANEAIGYIWKIKFNETSKIPALSNVVPEFCHNEINGLDPVLSNRSLTINMHVLLFEDQNDDPRNQKRMQVAGDIFNERGIEVTKVPVRGGAIEKALDAAVLADWVSYSLAAFYGVPDEQTPLVAEFKKRIAS